MLLGIPELSTGRVYFGFESNLYDSNKQVTIQHKFAHVLVTGRETGREQLLLSYCGLLVM